MYFSYLKTDTSKIEMEFLMNHYVQSVRIEKKELMLNIPELPGVYLMKNAEEEIIYIGKSKNIRKRVQSYFTQSKQHSKKVMKMVVQVKKIDYIVTGTELEALLLESKLIKEKLPLYNKQLRNYKSYGYIKITQSEEYPRLVPEQHLKDDGEVYYGPYSNSQELEFIIDALRESFGLRRCHENSGTLKSCIYHQIGDCLSPCVDLGCKKRYDEAVRHIRLFLEGQSKAPIELLENKRDTCCENLRFEKAKELQSKIDCLKKFYNYCTNYMYDIEKRNIILFLPSVSENSITILLILRGRVWNTYHYEIDELKEKDIPIIAEDIHSGFIKTDHWVSKKDVDEIMIIGRWLRENQDYPYSIILEQGLKYFDRDFSNVLAMLRRKIIL